MLNYDAGAAMSNDACLAVDAAFEANTTVNVCWDRRSRGDVFEAAGRNARLGVDDALDTMLEDAGNDDEL